MRILIIEDNFALADLINTCLSKFYVIDKVNNVHKAQYFLDIKTYDFLIVDLDSTNDSGYSLCHYLKDRHIYMPVLLLTTVLTVEQKINCLKHGNDYLIKPFSILELTAKVKNLLRKIRKNKLKKIVNTNFEIDQISHKVYFGKREVALNRKEFLLLELFTCYPKQVFSKAMLAEKVWLEEKVLMGNAIETTIFHLRQKIGKNFIKTIKGVGYVIR